MNHRSYDIVVIGSGPGGEGAAVQAAKSGLRVAVVERFARVGGGCVHWGTIPSKALRHAVGRFAELQSNPLVAGGAVRPMTYPEMRRAAQSVINNQEELRRGFYQRNNVPVLCAQARFTGPHTLQAIGANGSAETLEAKSFVIATGSRPYHPDDVDFAHPRIHDADSILTMDETPSSMTIYGAGVIGCEYASIFRGLGMKVNLVNTRGMLLDFLDDEIIDALAYHLRDRGVVIRHMEEYERVEGVADGVVLHLKSGKKLKTDVLLWTNGRTGNTSDLGLETLGIAPNHRGQIDVNEHFQTTLPHVYAVGDVIGPPALASAAYDQGRSAARHVVHGAKVDHQLVQHVPTGIYTSPEISSIGRTEKELTEKRIPYEVGRAQFKHLARAQIAGQTVGMLKILFHRDTLEILGIHCFGGRASEIIHIGQAIMAQKGEANTLMYFVNTTFNYPTMAEAYRVAALNGYNRLF